MRILIIASSMSARRATFRLSVARVTTHTDRRGAQIRSCHLNRFRRLKRRRPTPSTTPGPDDSGTSSNWIGAGLAPAPPTPPDVRVRIRRFAQHSRKRR